MSICDFILHSVSEATHVRSRRYSRTLVLRVDCGGVGERHRESGKNMVLVEWRRRRRRLCRQSNSYRYYAIQTALSRDTARNSCNLYCSLEKFFLLPFFSIFLFSFSLSLSPPHLILLFVAVDAVLPFFSFYFIFKKMYFLLFSFLYSLCAFSACWFSVRFGFFFFFFLLFVLYVLSAHKHTHKHRHIIFSVKSRTPVFVVFLCVNTVPVNLLAYDARCTAVSLSYKNNNNKKCIKCLTYNFLFSLFCVCVCAGGEIYTRTCACHV